MGFASITGQVSGCEYTRAPAAGTVVGSHGSAVRPPSMAAKDNERTTDSIGNY